MRLSAALVPGVALSLGAVAVVADRALVGRASALRSNAELRIGEDARLAAQAVALALAGLERDAVAGRERAGLEVERLAARPAGASAPAGFRPYGERSRAELIGLLSSERASPMPIFNWAGRKTPPSQSKCSR
jgi:hypothetical protein